MKCSCGFTGQGSVGHLLLGPACAGCGRGQGNPLMRGFLAGVGEGNHRVSGDGMGG